MRRRKKKPRSGGIILGAAIGGLATGAAFLFHPGVRNRVQAFSLNLYSKARDGLRRAGGSGTDGRDMAPEMELDPSKLEIAGADTGEASAQKPELVRTGDGT